MNKRKRQHGYKCILLNRFQALIKIIQEQTGNNDGET